MFQDEQWKFRDICNKIIHSDTFSPSFCDADEGHSTDYAYNKGYDAKSVNWKHFSGYVRLAGKEFKNDWHILLDIEAFIIAIQRLMSVLSDLPMMIKTRRKVIAGFPQPKSKSDL